MIGQTFGRLTVVSETSERSANGCIVYICKCVCGEVRLIPGMRLRNGQSKSCGCLAREMSSKRERVHGLSKHRLFPTWDGMMGRCYRPHDPAFDRYGGRGIAVCKRWHDVRNFIGDNDHLALPGLSIDRIDNDLGYTVKNTRWATRTEQALNKRSNVRLTYKGRTQTLFEWAREVGIPPRTLWARIRARGWPVDKALETPVKKSQQKQQLNAL